MNCGIKVKAFFAAAANVNPGQPLETVLEPGAQLVGIVCVASGAADQATVLVYDSVQLVVIPLVGVDATGPDQVVKWWAGTDGRYKNDDMPYSGPIGRDVNGTLPHGFPAKRQDTLAGQPAPTLSIQIVNAVLGSVIIYYTVDPPTPGGIHD